MSLTLHAAFVPSCIQLLGAQSRLIDTAAAFCTERGLAPADLLGARLAEDMLPYAYQVKSTVVHSLGAIEGVRAGRFSPDQRALAESFAELKRLVEDTIAALGAIDPAELDGLVGRDVRFATGSRVRRR